MVCLAITWSESYAKIKVDLSEKCDCIVTFEIWYGRETEEFFYFEEIWRVKLSIWQLLDWKYNWYLNFVLESGRTFFQISWSDRLQRHLSSRIGFVSDCPGWGWTPGILKGYGCFNHPRPPIFLNVKIKSQFTFTSWFQSYLRTNKDIMQVDARKKRITKPQSKTNLVSQLAKLNRASPRVRLRQIMTSDGIL